MPKETKHPLFCCGEHHKSANYHRRTVHQQHTKIYWKGNPRASFILRRNPITSLFHCPHCDKSWAMATPIRNHIFLKCEGYAQYRSGTSPKNEIVEAELSMSSPGAERSSSVEILQDATPGEVKTDPVTKAGQHPQITRTPSPSPAPGLKAQAPQPIANETKRLGSTAPPSLTSEEFLEQSIHVPPILRPAVWSPIGTSPIASRGLHDLGPSTSLSGNSYLGSLHNLARSASCSSKSSAITLVDDPKVLCIYHKRCDTIIEPKREPDDLSASHSSLLAASPLPRQPPSQPTAVMRFLEDLRRPLGHTAPLLYKMGLVTEEDLDLLCSMPEAWDEVGAVLQVGGITKIEWLMVKEAFKARFASGL
ncbi:hypothetical protein C8Q79DRAFT_106053 [Trametes meyenii]|nr:hypothetical protein C8Q79DRAFT_106053 [Trametes meyenii]